MLADALAPTLSAMTLLSSHGLQLGDFTVPWSVVIMVAVVVIGLLLIRTVITLVKVAILVAIAIAIYLLVQFALDNFNSA